jgi:AcrR family transcriptional regulator
MRPEKVEKKKHDILDALKKRLLTNVYSQISFEDVAETAGMSKGGIRHYYPTKESLFIALIEDFFQKIEEEQIQLVKVASSATDKALLSTMYSVEKFLMNKDNTIIFVNIILYSFEEQPIREIVQSFLQQHLGMYENILKEADENSETDPAYVKQVCRTIQVLLLSAGLFETLDPIGYDSSKMVETALSLLKPKKS